MYNHYMMKRKGNEMTEFETNCYGMTEADIREDFDAAYEEMYGELFA